jgi:hypothetical protein
MSIKTVMSHNIVLKQLLMNMYGQYVPKIEIYLYTINNPMDHPSKEMVLFYNP